MLSGVRSSILEAVKPLHRRFREEKLSLFFKLLEGSSRLSLLDVGGGLGIDNEFAALYEAFAHVTVVNLEPHRMTLPSRKPVHSVVADGCNLPFASHSFDWVFSNAVIEHVGPRERQQQFAKEIRRVAAEGYFVTTPNRYFPIEPHALLPFYQFLSPAWQRRALRFSPGYMREYEEIHLLSARQLQELFPESRVVDSGSPLVGNSLIASYSASSKD